MTNYPNLAGHCAYTAAALATLGAAPEWDARLTEYLRLQALQEAHSLFGPLSRAEEANAIEHGQAEARHGPNWRNVPAALASVSVTAAAALAVEDQWTQEYCRPFWRAARELACTPAPSLQAALFKVRLIEWEEIDNDAEMTRDCFEIVAEDMARLARGRVGWRRS